MTKRIAKLTPDQESQMPEWARQWIAIGQCTDEADWARFEDAARRCYQFADLPWHGNVVRVANPLVLSLAAPIAAWLLENRFAASPPRRGAVGGAVHGRSERHV